jgi:hypothetical protein
MPTVSLLADSSGLSVQKGYALINLPHKSIDSRPCQFCISARSGHRALQLKHRNPALKFGYARRQFAFVALQAAVLPLRLRKLALQLAVVFDEQLHFPPDIVYD